jgi:membrane protease YdiL (CAAX protease family)
MVRSDFIMEVRRDFVGPAERRLRAPWRLILWVFLGGFVAIVFTALFGAVPAPNGGGAATVAYAFVEQLWGYAVLLLAGLGVGYLLDRRTMADFGLGLDRQWWRDAGFGLLLGFGLPTLVLLVELATGLPTVTGVLVTPPGGMFTFGVADAATRIGLLALFFAVQATAEEILVRGYLLTNLAEGGAGSLGRVKSVVAATVATAVLFGALPAINPHAPALSGANITRYGVVLGAC